MYRAIHLAPPSPSPECVAVGMFSGAKTLPPAYAGIDRRTGGALSAALARAEFSARKGEWTVLYPPKGCKRLYILGLGEEQRFTLQAVRAAASKLLAAAFAARLRRVDLHLTGALRLTPSPAASLAGGNVGEGRGEGSSLSAAATESLGRAIGDGLAIANCDFTQFKGAAQNGGAKKPPTNLTLILGVPANLRPHVQRALDIGQSLNMIRGLAMTPPNIANPAYLAAFCRRIAPPVGLRCTVIDAARAKKLGLNGLLAVGGAGSTPPALICLEWNGLKHASAKSGTSARRGQEPSPQPSPSEGRGGSSGPLLLVGKAITFDTGGYSIKPAESLDKMKYDKCGGLAVIGALHAAARLQLPIRVIGLISAAENMIAPTAYRPADILRMFNGVTVEVTNTDAEGRLVLGDALAYGCKTYRPHAVVDLATLTGGVVVALGSYCAGLFCDAPGLRAGLFDAADFTGERLWPLPLWEEHRQQIKGAHGDIVNSAGREATPIQGAAFLSYFTGKDGQPHSIAPGFAPPGAARAVDSRAGEQESSRAQSPSSLLTSNLSPLTSPTEPAWAHVDIAGMVDARKDDPVYPPGPTGFGVRLLVRLMESWSDGNM
jgi:leucyl aminopeptidase